MRFWIKNTEGRPDAVLTMAIVGFVVVLVKVLLSGLTFTFEGRAIELGSIDASAIAAILTPTLGAYVSRRYTDRKFRTHAEEKKE